MSSTNQVYAGILDGTDAQTTAPDNQSLSSQSVNLSLGNLLGQNDGSGGVNIGNLPTSTISPRPFITVNHEQGGNVDQPSIHQNNISENSNYRNNNENSNGSNGVANVEIPSIHHMQTALQMQQQHHQHLMNSSYIQQQHQQYMNHPLLKLRLYRKGKWTQEEEEFTKALITAFNDGCLSIPTGTTLRSFLSEKLNCDPMRITKKFSGDHSIGKQMYQPCRDIDREEVTKVQAQLKKLEAKFIAAVEPKNSKNALPPEFLTAPHMFNQFLQQNHTMGMNHSAPSSSSFSYHQPSGMPQIHPAVVAAAAANMYRHQAIGPASNLHGMAPPMMGSILNTGGNGTNLSSSEDGNNNNKDSHEVNSDSSDKGNPFSLLPKESPMSVNDQMANLNSSVPPLDMNVYFAQYQMEALAQAKAYALAQAHAYESYAVEQAQKNDFSDTYKHKRGNSIYHSNDSDSSGGKDKHCSEETTMEQRIKEAKEAEKTEAKDSELLINFFEASKGNGLVPPSLGLCNFSGLPTYSDKKMDRSSSTSADVTSKEDSSHDSNVSNNNGSDGSNERESDVSESSSDLDNNAPNSSVSDGNSNDTPPPEEKRDESALNKSHKKRYLSSKDGLGASEGADNDKDLRVDKKQKIVDSV